MFEDSLVESAHRIHTRSSRYAAGSLLLETALLAVILLIPCLYPAALPRKFLALPIVAPPPPPTPAASQRKVATSAASSTLLQIDLTAPSSIPATIPRIDDRGSSVPPGTVDFGTAAQATGPIGAEFPGVSPAPLPRVRPPQPAGPLRVSAGVAAGQLIASIRPEYPAIARAARTQGTVVVSATISPQGRIGNLHVVSGPPLLVNAAVTAIRDARCRPYLLNGQPVEVETTINVIFSLGDR